ncbi:glutaredoxin 3 [Porticoccus sp. GXU_MW_L64]
MSDVVLYGTRFCPYCIAARRLLKRKGVDFKDISVDSNRKLRTEVMQRSGQRTVPQIWVGSTHVGGFDDLQRLESNGKLDKLLAGA